MGGISINLYIIVMIITGPNMIYVKKNSSTKKKIDKFLIQNFDPPAQNSS